VLHTLVLQFTALNLKAWPEGVAIGIKGSDFNLVKGALRQIIDGDVPRGAKLAKLAQNQLEEKYDWALTAGLRCADYASRHLDESGARDTAGEILKSHNAL
jgi:hypothetical protein